MTSEIDETHLFSAQSGNRLSIVMQGGINAGNIAEVASHCRHWRDMFPFAEIILSISTLDIIGGTQADGEITGLFLHLLQGQGGMAHTALEVIRANCDKVVQARGALPLPPIKTDSPGLNNVNLQISAAQAGLAVATGTHILRVRSDLIFTSHDFIGQWLAGNMLPRGQMAVFAGRVLISYLYTLNPYTYERLPFHYSDWFHFGLAADVQAIWDVAFMTLADATYYKTHGCAAHSNHQERRMLTRLAVEQHISYSVFQKHFSGLLLEYHNDMSNIKLSIDILCDNFIICDLNSANIIFDKYNMDFENLNKRLHCIPPDDWQLLVNTAPQDREAILLQRAEIVAYPERAPFPRHYPASALNTQIGEYAHGAIMAMESAGMLLHGPYDTLPRGSYTAVLDLHRLDGKGMLGIRVTLDQGKVVLARHEIALSNQRNQTIDIDFDIPQDVGNLLEVVVETPGVPLIALGDLTIRRRVGSDAATFGMRLLASQHPLNTKVGTRTGGILRTTATAGCLVYGPYATLDRGNYTLEIDFVDVQSAGRSSVNILGGSAQSLIMYRTLHRHDLATGKISVDFTIARTTENVEFRVSVDRTADFAVGLISVYDRKCRVSQLAILKNNVRSRYRQIVDFISAARLR